MITVAASRVGAPPDVRRLAILAALAILLAAVLMLAICLGPMRINAADVLGVFADKLGMATTAVDPVVVPVILEIRLPRILLAATVGAILGVSGAVLQGLFRNPLADPALIGVSSGAALGAAGYIVFGAALVAVDGVFAFGGYGRALAAFLGGVTTTLLIFRLSGARGRTALATLLLAGIAINALGGAGVGLLTYLSSDRELRDIAFWTLGSFGGASWHACWLLLPVAFATTAIFTGCAESLNIFLLGEAEARHLGIRVQRLKTLLVTLVAFGVGLSVAFTGMIGFIGLVTPHLLRLAGGPDHRLVIPGAALLGAVLTVVADTLARTIVAPAELPVGILTALIGAPFFMWLLVRQRGMEE